MNMHTMIIDQGLKQKKVDLIKYLTLATSPGIVRRAIKYSIVVGTILIFINHGDSLLKGNIDKLKEEENKYGEIIKIIIGSNVLKEGADFFNIRQIHFGNIWHNMSKIYQIIGRGARFCSHSNLNDNERNIVVFKYCCMYKDNDKETVDEKMWRESENKDRVIKKIERILKTNSIDCYLNKNSNYFVFETILIIQKHLYDEILPKITHISFRLMPSFAESL